jgi:hypothetical protein
MVANELFVKNVDQYVVCLVFFQNENNFKKNRKRKKINLSISHMTSESNAEFSQKIIFFLLWERFFDFFQTM